MTVKTQGRITMNIEQAARAAYNTFVLRVQEPETIKSFEGLPETSKDVWRVVARTVFGYCQPADAPEVHK